MKKLFLSLLAAAVLAGASVHAQQVQPLERIVAVVDEDIILQTELDRAVANVLSQYDGRSDQLPPRHILERQVLERLVLVRLQTAQASQMGVRVSDAEVDGAVGMIAQQNGFSPDQLRQQLASEGLSFDEFRASLREELMIQRLRQRFAQTRVVVSDAEVDAALEGQANNRQYQLAHILVALPDGATPDQIATAEERVNGVKSLIDRGEMAFQAAAVRYSDSPNALEGGDLGWRSLDEIPTSFAGAVQSMQPGEILGPLRGPSGYQLLQLVDVRDTDGASGSVTQYQARHILIRSGGEVTDDQAEARARTLRARAVGGADFAELARENTDDASSRDNGGDLGWFTVDQFGPDFGAQVAGLADGGVSEPFRTQAGWHVVQRIGTRQTAASDENRRAQVREAIGQRKLEDEWNRFLREIRGEAYVDVRNGDSDPAATGG
ncbi:peptidylprolyl isomerase [Luteimonas abyssi]|uniref:peptidylprolyl isomerase n=1 Tax=Luteimonas abyssi TaxID=1247514 RepID=UPI000737C0CC|nr:peptidylprolyl isomerase [Luteimonas abyssi]